MPVLPSWVVQDVRFDQVVSPNRQHTLQRNLKGNATTSRSHFGYNPTPDQCRDPNAADYDAITTRILKGKAWSWWLTLRAEVGTLAKVFWKHRLIVVILGTPWSSVMDRVIASALRRNNYRYSIRWRAFYYGLWRVLQFSFGPWYSVRNRHTQS